MAPSEDKDGADKYKGFSRSQLEDECKKRELEYDAGSTDDDLIAMFLKDDNAPNWGRVYAQLMHHYHMAYDAIGKLTLPQIRILSRELPEQLRLGQMFMPNIFGFNGTQDVPVDKKKPGKPPKLSEFMAFASAFDGIK